MDVQNISGPDVVNATIQNGNDTQQNENSPEQQSQVQTVNEQDKGSSYDSYA